MENQKNNKGVIALLIIIIVILSTLCVLFATDTINFNSKGNNNNELSNENITEEDNTLDGNKDNQKQEENNNEKTDESNFIRETKITLIDEPNCTGNGSPLIATIESNGNISIAQNKEKAEIAVGNAKYLYRVSLHACDSFILYYITEDKELYKITNPKVSTVLNQKATKATESKVIEFLGVVDKSDGRYLKVLLESGEIEYIKYLHFLGHNT